MCDYDCKEKMGENSQKHAKQYVNQQMWCVQPNCWIKYTKSKFIKKEKNLLTKESKNMFYLVQRKF